MITERKAIDRGEVKLDWLHARHSFSFGSYFDSKWMGFRSLRVINHDIIKPGGGFATHGHDNMEIITFILKGELEHKDTLGNTSIIRPGEIQIMGAGSGIRHSEFNPIKDAETELLQIWVEPNVRDIDPRYEQYKYQEKENDLTLIAGPEGGHNVAKIYQQASLSVGIYNENAHIVLDDKKHYWVQVFEGAGSLTGRNVSKGDGLALSHEVALEIAETSGIKFLLFELA